MTSTSSSKIAFVDLQAQRRRLGTGIDEAISRVLNHGKFIMGPEIEELEGQLSAFANVKHCISCGSGTDALLMALMAWGIGPGDAVLIPSFTFASTAEVVVLTGATPVFVDVSEGTFNMDTRSLEGAVDEAVKVGLRPAAVIPVDLFGQPADYESIRAIAASHGLLILADSAQSFGATVDGKSPVSLGDAGATSFFPAKPLGCYGDGGAIFTHEDEVAARLRSIRVHGQGSDKYDNVRIGINGRLDTIQAAILIQKLTIFRKELEARNQIAARYEEGLSGAVRTPTVLPDRTSAWAQYTIICDGRDEVAEKLRNEGIPTAVYYPKPLHQQTAYRSFPHASGGLAVSENLSAHVLSLPMHPYLDTTAQQEVIQTVLSTVAR